MAKPDVNPGSKRRGKQMVVSLLQHGWLKAMGVDVPWIAADEPQVKAITAPAVGAALVTRSAPIDEKLSRQAQPLPVRPQQSPTQSASTQSAPIQSAPIQSASRPSLKSVLLEPARSGPQKPAAMHLSDLSWSELRDSILACQRCGLCETRTHAVPGDGVDKPTVLIVGEAPGEQEDLDGKPFVGRSGQLLDNMLKAIGHARDTTVFITNVVKCRPPANRNPRDDEILACEAYLARQIEMLAPKAILAMGRFAAHALLKSEVPLQQLREHTHTLELGGQSLPVVVTYHPAYLLGRSVDKRLAWEDLKRLRGLVS